MPVHDDNETNEAHRNYPEFGYEVITFTREEIEGYIFAGMKAMNAFEKWGGEDLARRTARGFAESLMPRAMRDKFVCTQCRQGWQPIRHG